MSIKFIPLTKGQFAIVDANKFEYLNQWKWHITSRGYAGRKILLKERYPNGMCKQKYVYMHREVLGVNEIVDHKNRDQIDNRADNLRVCTNTQNQINRDKHKNNKSGYKGVSWHKGSRKWRAQTYAGGKTIGIGTFSCAIAAAKAYDRRVRAMHGEYALTNFGDEDEY